MATDRQTEANRQNAQKSTGPRTAQGKARSCLNHVTTGIDAQSVIIPGEDPAEYQALSARYFGQFLPATEDERYQVDTLVGCDWQARRLVRAEAQIWRRTMEGAIRRNEPNPMAEAYALVPKTFTRLDRRVQHNERAYNRARHELQQLQSARFAAEALEFQAEPEPEPAPPPPQPAETAPPAEELGSNDQNAPEAATPQPQTPDPTPATPRFGPKPASVPFGTPEQAPPKTA